jgi:hypothetical protein
MSKKKVVVFYFDKSKSPKVFTNPKSLAELQKEGDILVNPNVPKGIAPNEWKLVNGKIRGPAAFAKAFPEDMHTNTKGGTWTLRISLLSLIVLNTYQEKESIIALVREVVAFFK